MNADGLGTLWLPHAGIGWGDCRILYVTISAWQLGRAAIYLKCHISMVVQHAHGHLQIHELARVDAPDILIRSLSHQDELVEFLRSSVLRMSQDLGYRQDLKIKLVSNVVCFAKFEF